MYVGRFVVRSKGFRSAVEDRLEEIVGEPKEEAGNAAGTAMVVLLLAVSASILYSWSLWLYTCWGRYHLSVSGGLLKR